MKQCIQLFLRHKTPLRNTGTSSRRWGPVKSTTSPLLQAAPISLLRGSNLSPSSLEGLQTLAGESGF